MFDGLDYFKHLGLYWCACFVALAALGDFTSSDSSTLANIATDVGAIHGSLDSQANSVASILTSVNQIRSSSGDSLLELEGIYYRAGDISTDLDSLLTLFDSTPDTVGDIYDTVRDIYYFLSNLEINTVRRYSDNAAADSLSTHDVRTDDIYTRLGTMQSAFQADFDDGIHGITNSLNSNFNSLISSVNNLTNYLCYSSSYVFTNRYAQYFPQTYSLSLFDQSRIRKYFKFYYGYEPSNSEIQDFRNTVGALALYDMASSYVTLLPESAVPSGDWGSWNLCRGLLDSVGLDNGAKNIHKAIGNSRYYAYGTRVLTDTSIGISNLVSSINLKISNAFDSVQGNYAGATALNGSLQRPVVYGSDGSVKNDSGIVNAVVSLAGDWEGSIPGLDTNGVSRVATNAIVNLEDPDYSRQLNTVTRDSILNDPIQSQLSDAVSSINQQIVSFFPSFQDQNELVLNFGTFSIFGQSKTITFVFQRLPLLYWTLQTFFLSTLKVICLILAVNAIYHHVAVDSSM